LKVPVKRELLADPLSGFAGYFEKEGWVSRGGYPIRIRWAEIPAYLPEIGSLISLEATSPEIGADFMELRKGEVAVLKLHNFDPDWRRAVSWGCYKLEPLGEFERIYSTSLFLDLALTPSMWVRGAMFSPLRWFPLECHVPLHFRCMYSYNLFLAFVDPKERRGRKEIWLGRSVRIVPVRVREIELRGDGWMDSNEIYLSFEEEDLDEFLKWGSAGYYLCLAEGFNDYQGGRSPGKNVNIARGLYPLVHSPYDIMPLLFPEVTPENKDITIRFSVSRESLEKILNRLGKFEGTRGIPDWEESGKLYLGLARVEKKEKEVLYEVVNPTVIATLVRRSLGSDVGATFAKEILSEPWELMDRVKRARKDWELSLLGVGEFLETKAENLRMLEEGHETAEG
jgi:hypothetical protein